MGSMTSEDNKQLIHRFIETYERHDLEALWDFYSPDCRYVVLTRFGIEPTLENYKRFMANFLVAFPDVHHQFADIVAEGGNVWVHYKVTGTHEGVMRGVAPSHQKVSYSIVAMYKVADGKITQADFVADDLTMLRQIGGLPS
jgi:steroid delta-isomerase-like uncharacterized protein